MARLEVRLGHLELAALCLHALVLAVLGGVVGGEEVLVVFALAVEVDLARVSTDLEHVRPEGDGAGDDLKSGPRSVS